MKHPRLAALAKSWSASDISTAKFPGTCGELSGPRRSDKGICRLHEYIGVARRRRGPMRKLAVVTMLCAIAVGCATQQQMLQQRQGEAVQTALARGRFDLNCPGATATV